MARPESIAVGGYYPFPAHLVPQVAQLIGTAALTQGTGTAAFVDPCAGDGAAVLHLMQQLFSKAVLTGAVNHAPKVELYTCELEQNRQATLANTAGELLGWRVKQDQIHGDLFRINAELSDQWHVYHGASLLWHNPPYDTDPQHERLEHRFLRRVLAFQRGGGVLAHIVPHYALAPSAELLAREYDQVACYRLPEPDYSVYKQVVLLAVRRNAPLTLDVASHPTTLAVRRWAADATCIPVLPAPGAVGPVVQLPASGGGFARWEIAPLDLALLHESVRPFTLGGCRAQRLSPGMGLDKALGDLIGRVHPVAMPLKPGHIAQALAGGVMNGKRIDPDQPGRPALLIKGVFEREYRTVDERTNKKTGEVTQLVQVQQPKLRVSVLDLSTATYHDLLPGTEPTGAAALDDQTIADILLHYGVSLSRLLREQCPPLHDPANPAHQIALPTVARTPFVAQRHAIQAGLKLLVGGANPFGMGEVGTGKSLMSAVIAYALAPDHYATTRAEMARLGVAWDRRLRPVRSVLILCPPHLLTSWRNEVAATLPGATVTVLERISDIPTAAPAPTTDPRPGAGMAFFVLSRETAKLGHGYESGLHGGSLCPACGTRIVSTAKEIVDGRLRCGHRARRPSNLAAELAAELAVLRATCAPDDWHVRTLTPRNVRRLARRAQERRQEAQERQDATYPTVEAAWASRALAGAADGLDRTPLGRLVRRLAAHIMAVLAGQGQGDVEALTAVLARLLVSISHEGRSAWAAGIVQDIYLASLADTSAHGRAADVRGWLRTIILLLDDDAAQDALIERLKARHNPMGGSYGSEQRWDAVASAITDLRHERAGGKLHHPNNWDARSVKRVSGQLVWRLDYQHEHPAGALFWAADALRLLAEQATFTVSEPCGEPLYQAAPTPRRFPLAQAIAKRARGVFDLLLIDEGHEYNNLGTAQEQAAHRLVQLGLPTITLSGSILSGYVSSMFANLLHLNRAFAATFGRDGKAAFVTRYGYRKRLVELDEEKAKATKTPQRYGSHSDRVMDGDYALTRSLGEAPGVLPLFLLDWLLPNAFVIHKADLDLELPPLRELPVPVALRGAVGKELAGRYDGLQQAIVERIGEDRWEPDLAGKLFGALGQALTYLDRATTDTGNGGQGGWEARYPETAGGAVVHRAPLFPSGVTLPKEAWLLETVANEMDEGRNVVVFLSNTGKDSGLAPRLLAAINSALGDVAVMLDTGKVDTRRRQDWISAEVVGAGKRVLLVNPIAIKTGLNNLVPHFSTAIWYQDPHADAITYRQANGRLHRIGQTNPVRIYAPYYAETAQELALGLLARKVGASLAVDGLDIASALEAAGAGDRSDSLDLMDIGRAIYEQLAGERSLAA